MKLFNVPRHSTILVSGEYLGLPKAPVKLTFDHIDGMYSVCYDSNDNIVHLAAWSDVEVVEASDV